MGSSDLHVDPISAALSGKTIEVIVAGSIGAVESVRFIRALRRLGANVLPVLTDGGAQFITEIALSWAAANPTRRQFSGEASHLATGDACVIAPASANILRKIAQGITDTPSAALATSYLGAKKPLIIVPNMHDSLAEAPAVQQNLATVQQWATVLSPRLEEGKRKFPEPNVLADQVAHEILRKRRPSGPVLVTLGSTRGYIDDVRYISNLSSGKLGSMVCEELYRNGYEVTAICGPRQFSPQVSTKLINIETNDELLAACKQQIKTGISALIMSAAALDFIPEKQKSGKIDSKTADALTITCKKAPKILAEISGVNVPKIAFKLTAGLDAKSEAAAAADYIKSYGLSMLVHNRLEDISLNDHKAQIHVASALSKTTSPLQSHGKGEIAKVVVQHLLEQHKHVTA